MESVSFSIKSDTLCLVLEQTGVFPLKENKFEKKGKKYFFSLDIFSATLKKRVSVGKVRVLSGSR
jgi:hypothetical protein